MAPRADAARNTELLLSAAKELVEEHGTEVALDQIARRAGVGNATLYRHFPTRADLLIAVYEDEVTALCDHGEELLTSASASQALFTWLESLATHTAAKRTLALSASERQPERRTALFERWHGSIRSVTERLLDRATAAGVVRGDIDLTDLLVLTSASASAAGGAEQVHRLVRIICDGLRPHRETDA